LQNSARNSLPKSSHVAGKSELLTYKRDIDVTSEEC